MALALAIAVPATLLAASAMGLLMCVRDLKILPVHAASYQGVGAYAAAASLLYLNSDIFTATLVGLIAATVYGALISVLLKKRTSDRQLLLLVAIQMVFELLAQVLVPVTGGPTGITVPRDIVILGLAASGPTLSIAAIAGAATLFFSAWLAQMRLGAAISIVGTGEEHALGMGLRVGQLTLASHAIAAGTSGGIGALYAAYVGYIDPTPFRFDTSIWLIVVVLFAVNRPVMGTIIGAAAVAATTEGLRFLGFPVLVAGQLRQILAGLVIGYLVVGKHIFPFLDRGS